VNLHGPALLGIEFNTRRECSLCFPGTQPAVCVIHINEEVTLARSKRKIIGQGAHTMCAINQDQGVRDMNAHGHLHDHEHTQGHGHDRHARMAADFRMHFWAAAVLTLLAFDEHGNANNVPGLDDGDDEAVIAEFVRQGGDDKALAENCSRKGRNLS
jgi:hypothetical protein